MPSIQSLKKPELLAEIRAEQVGRDGTTCPSPRTGGGARDCPGDGEAENRPTRMGDPTQQGLQEEGRSHPVQQQRTPPAADRERDRAGFGQHASLTYEEVYHQYPSYCSWAVTIFQEEDEGDKLARFARWVLHHQETEKGPGKEPSKLTPITPRKGYPQAKAKAKIPPKVWNIATSSEKASTSQQPPPEKEMLKEIMTVLTDLKQDVDALKEERPHKKRDSSEADFNIISGPSP